MLTHLALFMLVTLFISVKSVQITISEGTLEGEKLTTVVFNKTYYSFKGIPYAAPPVGPLRFKAPEPPKNWTGIRDAKAHGSSCPQIDIFTLVKNPGNEDCLFLNVYSPNLTPSTPLPVIVFFHGGGFKSGSGNSSTYGPDFIVAHDMVLVTMNYRLEALGFLSLGTEEIPGNAGLKDQVAALKWVQKHITKFGGNPKQVTIMGQSAGSASVSYHVLSPLSKGLFKRAIGMSGVGLCDFVTAYRPVERAFILGKQLGIFTNDIYELQNKLQQAEVEKLYNTAPFVVTSEQIYDNLIKMYNFVPVVETIVNDNTFLAQDILEIMKNGSVNDVDVMFGYVSDETMPIVETINNTFLRQYDIYEELFVPSKWFFNKDPNVNIEVGRKIRDYYFGEATELDVNQLRNMITYTSHSSFVMDIIRFMNILPNKKNRSRYLYEFSMTSTLNVFGNEGVKFGFNGAVGHQDDLMYIFSTSKLNTSVLTPDSTELRLVKEYCTLVKNFAKYGHPTPSKDTSGVIKTTWPEFNTDTKSYMNIGNELTVGTDPEAEMLSFWQGIFEYVGVDFD